MPASARESLYIIEAQVQRMVEIIQHYLARTRDSVQHFQPADINTLITNTLALLKPAFQHQQIQVTSNLAEAMPRLQADKSSLQRVLINLFNNALDAMQTGGTLTVTSHLSTPSATSRPGRGIRVEVQDTGSGIPAEVLPTVFELFTTTKALGEGTGLGLGICQEILQAHGGSITLTSQEGHGTCVQVFLPIQANDPPVPTPETL